MEASQPLVKSLGEVVATPVREPDIRVTSAAQLCRFLVEIQLASTDPPEDYLATSVFFANVGGSLTSSSDWTTAATTVLHAFSGGYTPSGGSPFLLYRAAGITVKGYDLADAKPRPVRALVNYVPPGYMVPGNMAPNELAVPLRFYSQRNTKDQRGRIYVGAWQRSQAYRTVQSTDMTSVLNLGLALFDIAVHGSGFGTLGSTWCVWSRKLNLFWPIDHMWVNDQWAHMESREHIETARDTATGVPVTTGPISGPTIP